MSVEDFEARIEYVFENKSLIMAALTHRSYAFEHANAMQNNQRLEFLGDAILDFIIADDLCLRYPKEREGELSRLRSRLVCEGALAILARKLGFDKEIRMGKGEVSSSGMMRDGTLADAYEAVIGAIYRDGGIEPARRFILTHHKEFLDDPDGQWLASDDKTRLQLLAQANHKAVVYETIRQDGPSHAPMFEVAVSIDSKRIATGAGRSKKEAQQAAAAAAQDLQSTWGTAFSEKTQREYLASKGYSEEDINAALESQRKLASGTVTDYKAGTITDAVAQAQSLDEAYRQGALTVEEYDAAKAQNSKVIMDNVNKGMVRIDDVNHAALGISDEEWSGMNDSDKKLTVIDQVGQLVKQGVVDKSAYFQMVENEVSLDIQEIKDGGSRDKNKELLSVAAVVQDLYDNGYITINAYNYMMFKDILPSVNIKELQDIYRNLDEKKIMTYGDDRNAAAEVLLRYYLDNTKEEEKTVPDSKKRTKMSWRR